MSIASFAADAPRPAPTSLGCPFSDILQLTEASSVVSRGISAGGAWSLRFPRPGKLKFFALARGQCWVREEGRKKGLVLDEGDVMLLSGRRGFVIADGPDTPAKDAHRVLAARPEPIVELGDGDRSECVVLSGMVSLHPSSGPLLTEVLPPRIHVRAVSPRAASLRWIVEQILHEQRSAVPGAAAASAQLAQLLFIQLLRAHLASAGTLPSGWLRAISDDRLTPALRLIHGDPQRSWTVAELAKAAGMSRTSFAVRFKAAAGAAPLSYLTSWRMHLARRSLRESDTPIAEIAAAVGYTSESAFSTAFKRVAGSSPRSYRVSNGHKSI
ncbi:AraC family transcriptional regulator [Enhygromyxa salina]|uniref:HTH-type transcriptional activator Btr n=1 Tax=Enhygromyxa salina TaxID=215803 RepID=A0A2S9YUV8_9BACT|nr:AraC family transcriptional regulator [Enhygromyxa salina]PRQ08829.1 HTH-type transcriptional activator Btr [Enhygromyxa salina]